MHPQIDVGQATTRTGPTIQKEIQVRDKNILDNSLVTKQAKNHTCVAIVACSCHKSYDVVSRLSDTTMPL